MREGVYIQLNIAIEAELGLLQYSKMRDALVVRPREGEQHLELLECWELRPVQHELLDERVPVTGPGSARRPLAVHTISQPQCT